MSSVSVDTSEVTVLAGAIRKLATKVKADARAILDDVAEQVATGYRAGVEVETGDLRASIAVSGEGDTRTIGSDSRYAGYHEFGTSDTVAHPALFPAGAKGAAELQRRLGDLGAI